ncbi:MAG: FtsX-like permease family protein [Microcella sp.]|uniref:FtsX-like permease family protein n=1 Tax=Microcella sp. TaxID=1913979 RepID=UPI0024CBC8E4|nr:FtsX-like permease family protein [Microcella sp.]UYN84408.1 MAG: FtsX-like permease family protein [Microcella sp.]
MTGRGGTLAAIAVITLSAVYITLLTAFMALLRTGLVSTPFGQGATADIVLGVLGSAFLLVALIVSTVVVTNAFVLVAASRVNDIALRRLLGASASSERRRMVAEGVRMSLGSTALGVLLGAGAAYAIFSAGSQQGGMFEDAQFSDMLNPFVIAPLAALQVCTVVAAWRGSAMVLAAKPVQALGIASTQAAGGDDEVRLSRAAALTLLGGIALLGLTFVAGAFTPLAAFLGIIAGTVVAIGVLAGASGIMPRVMALIARLLPARGPAALARRTVSEHPARTSRAALGVLIGVAVVSMFVVATASANFSLALRYEGSDLAGEADEVLLAVMGIVSALIGFVVIIAAVGLATTVALNTRLRAREIAVARILGQSRRDAATAIVLESAVLSLAAALSGLALGAVLGWVGAQSVIGVAMPGGVVLPFVPLPLIGVVLATSIVLTILSSAAPLRFVLADSPVRAFARA